MKQSTLNEIRSLTAGTIMNPSVITVRDDTTVHEAASLLTDYSISGAPVVDEKGKLVGVFSVTDIALDAAERGQEVETRFFRSFYTQGWEDTLDPEDFESLHVEQEDRLVRDVMTPTLYTISEGTTVGEVAKTMIAGRIHRLFVTRKGELVGIVTTIDLLKLFAG